MSPMTPAMPERRSLITPALVNSQTNVVNNLHRIDIQWGVERNATMPEDHRIASWVRQVFEILSEAPAEITIRIVSEDEIIELNGRFREMPKPTNVLSFPVGVKDEEGFMILGDIVLCEPVVIAEAEQQQKSVDRHFAHMIVHGMLHLKGFDHVQDDQAEEMENLERHLIQQLGFPDPYQEDK